MATFKSQYTTSELLNLLKRRSLTPYFWKYTKGEYTFFFVDNRRDFYMEDGFITIVADRSNYFRLRNKIKFLPFRLDLNSHSKKSNVYFFTLLPDSVFLNVCPEYRLNNLNDVFNGNLTVNVVVI